MIKKYTYKKLVEKICPKLCSMNEKDVLNYILNGEGEIKFFDLDKTLTTPYERLYNLLDELNKKGIELPIYKTYKVANQYNKLNETKIQTLLLLSNDIDIRLNDMYQAIGIKKKNLINILIAYALDKNLSGDMLFEYNKKINYIHKTKINCKCIDVDTKNKINDMYKKYDCFKLYSLYNSLLLIALEDFGY